MLVSYCYSVNICRMMFCDEEEEETLSGQVRRKKIRRMLYEHIEQDMAAAYRANTTRVSYQRNDYWSYSWGRMLLTGRCGDESTREGKYFRRGFRVPYDLYCKIVQVTRDAGVFDESHRSSPNGNQVLSSPDFFEESSLVSLLNSSNRVSSTSSCKLLNMHMNLSATQYYEFCTGNTSTNNFVPSWKSII